MSSFRQSVTIYRKASGSYDARGIYTEGSETSFEINASIQPSKPSDLQMLDEGRRQNKTFRLYTNSELQAIDLNTKTGPDQPLLFNERFEVVATFPWQNNVINHHKYLVQKLKEN